MNIKSLTDEERLRVVKKITDKVIYAYDKCCFDNRSCQEFNNLREIKILLDALSDNMISSLENITEIILLDDVIIKPGETVVVNTNISDLNLDDKELIFEGYIPTKGYLNIIVDKEVKIENTLPKALFKDYIKDYRYCSSSTMKYIDIGVYKIKAGTKIGILYNKNKSKENFCKKKVTTVT